MFCYLSVICAVCRYFKLVFQLINGITSRQFSCNYLLRRELSRYTDQLTSTFGDETPSFATVKGMFEAETDECYEGFPQ